MVLVVLVRARAPFVIQFLILAASLPPIQVGFSNGSNVTVQAATPVANVDVRLVLAHGFLEEQVVRCCNVVVSVGFDALDSIVRVEAEFVEDLLVQGVVQWHYLLCRE